MSLEREKPEQIPNAENVENTRKIVNEQNNIPGQKKEINVTDYQGVAKLGQILKNISFPTDKKKIIEFVKLYVIDAKILKALENIEDKEYKNTSEVTSEAGLVY